MPYSHPAITVLNIRSEFVFFNVLDSSEIHGPLKVGEPHTNLPDQRRWGTGLPGRVANHHHGDLLDAPIRWQLSGAGRATLEALDQSVASRASWR